MRQCLGSGCVSYAINDDPAGKLCDRCWRDKRIAGLLAACQQARYCLLNLMLEDKNPMQKQMQKMVGELSKAIEKAEGE